MKLYVGTYAKYNNGNLDGKWMDLDDYVDADEFEGACRELHYDEDDPEFMCQDYESEYGWDGKALYSESGLPDNTYWDIKDALERLHIDDDVFAAWLDVTGYFPSGDGVEECSEQYCGKYDSPEEYAEELCTECGYVSKDMPSIISCNIDWRGVWRDLSYEGYEYRDGYVFDTNR